MAFRNDEEKKAAILDSLQALKMHPGWKVLQKVLDANIREVEKELTGDDEESVEPEAVNTEREWTAHLIRQKVLKAKRKDRLLLRDLPDNLILQYKDQEAFPVELDPYEK